MKTSMAMRLHREEKGVYAILFAIIIVVLFTMVAIAIDLSNARAEVRANQTRTDLAALAAAAHLPGNPVAACNEAWNYILLNVPGIPSSASSPCSGFITTCTASTPATEYQATGEAPYQISFVYPVPDNHPLMTGDGQGIGLADGADRCERFGVILVTTQDVLFGGIVGSTGLDAPANAVSRVRVETGQGTAVALLLLDPTGCNALLSSGQGGVAVFAHDGDNPGRITVDSDAEKNGNPNVCGNNTYSIDNSSQSQGSIKACGNNYNPADPTRCDVGGIIQLYGMDTGQLTCLPSSQNNACDPGDIANGRLYPVPTRAQKRSTRQTVDWEFNCKSGYPNYAPYGTPSIPISNCLTGMPPYMDQLMAGIGGETGNSPPSNLWTSTSNCTPANNTVFPPGNYYVNCNDFRVGSGNTVTFQGGNVVFRRNVTVHGTLRINTANPIPNLVNTCRRPNALTSSCMLESSSRHAFAVLKNGGVLTKSGQGSIDFNRVMVRLTDGGRINIGAGSPQVRWTAPFQRGFPFADDPSTPDVNEESPPGPFDKLALWSESTADHDLGGQSPLVIEGVYFIPNALFNFDGQATQFLDRAQFLTFRMNVSGLGQLRMQPNPQFVLKFPLLEVSLIR